MRALVTGATGFIGGHLARLLREAGWEVRALVRRGSYREHLEGLGLEWAEGDLTDPSSLRRAVEGCEAVFHLAALLSFWAPDPRAFYRTNVEGTRNLLRASLEAGVRRVVYTSTWAVGGRPPPGGLATEETPPDPRDLTGPYRWTKSLAEREALSFRERGLDLVVVRPTVPIGWGDIKPTPSGRLVLDFLRRRFPAYVEAYLNLIDVEDVARGHLLALEKGRRGEIYLLGHRNMTLTEVFRLLEEITGQRGPRLRLPWGLVYGLGLVDNLVEGRLLRREPLVPLEGLLHARRYHAVDCSKAVRELGLPQSPIEGALEKAVRWFREKGYVEPRRRGLSPSPTGGR